MNTKISGQELQTLRDEFRLYLHEKHPEWQNSTVNTHYSDAFYGLNNNIGIDFWWSFIDAETILVARDKIQEYLLNVSKVSKPKILAGSYLSSMLHFKAFLDEKHPTLAKNCSAKEIINNYLKKDFEVWMKEQKKQMENYIVQTPLLLI